MTDPIANLGADLSRAARTRLGKRVIVGRNAPFDRFREFSRDEPLARFLLRHCWLAVRLALGDLRASCRGIPRIYTRYTREYIALSLGIPQRREIFESHHRILAEKFKPNFLLCILEGRVLIWENVQDGVAYRITLTADRSLNGEGDLILELHDEGSCIFDLSFSVALASVVDGGEGLALLVSRVQGRPNLFDSIRRVTKASGDIFPGHLLLAAAEGIANVLSVSHLFGVSSTEQLSSRWKGVRFDYDSFWSELLDERVGPWYKASLPLPRKPIASLAKAHRRRTKRKRLFKDALTHQVADAIAQHLRPPSGAPEISRA